MKIIDLKEIKRLLQGTDLIPLIAEGFAAYSAGRAVIPPVGELLFDQGDVHIKYGYIKDDEFYVIKIASGFYNNAQYGLPSSNGLMLLFRQATGELAGILHDEGYLTNIRTAAGRRDCGPAPGAEAGRVHRHRGRGHPGPAATHPSQAGDRLPAGAGLGPGPKQAKAISGGDDGGGIHG